MHPLIFMVDLWEEEFWLLWSTSHLSHRVVAWYFFGVHLKITITFDHSVFHQLIKSTFFHDCISNSRRLHNYTVEWFWINKVKQDKQRSNKQNIILQLFGVWDLSSENNIYMRTHTSTGKLGLQNTFSFIWNSHILSGLRNKPDRLFTQESFKNWFSTQKKKLT